MKPRNPRKYDKIAKIMDFLGFDGRINGIFPE